MSHFTRYSKIAIIIGVFIAISFVIASVPTSTILDLVGSQNAYLLMFFLGMIGGLSTFVTIPYHLILMSLAAGGLNPILLGIATAFGVMGGDSLMYIVCRNLKNTFSPRLQATIAHLSHYFTSHPRLVTPGLFLYGAVSPFSNDFIVATMSLSKYPYLRTILPLMLGNCIFNITIAYIGLYSYATIIGWF
jgi:uncharacterized membrane protein YdjX (TVP38/TMEM64 family)